MSYILWYQLMPNKALGFLPCLVRHILDNSINLGYNNSASLTCQHNFPINCLFWEFYHVLVLEKTSPILFQVDMWIPVEEDENGKSWFHVWSRVVNKMVALHACYTNWIGSYLFYFLEVPELWRWETYVIPKRPLKQSNLRNIR